ncbi:hypothetical protein IWQ60_002069 [Tieghemiomyces parasiticus]|uniref:SET domain-containing protein n=1 Tax=Tieghemiomyces parasiticus TaxID=78921 RepID=A0A9W8ADD0_9FUNG|nr:hypothetical protein IWQ60_002069 [Tieghemiomyces parasiticus]
MLSESSRPKSALPKEPVAKAIPATPVDDSNPPPPRADLPKYNARLADDAAVRYDYNTTVGSHAAARDDLAPGTEVYTEVTAVGVVRHSLTALACDACFRALPAAPKPAEGQKAVPAGVGCADCAAVRYCSEDCRDRVSARHKLECALAAPLDKIRQERNMDPDLLRLAVRILALQHLGEAADVTDVPTRREAFDEAWVTAVSTVAEDLVAVLPENLATSADTVIDLACRISVFAQGFSDPTHTAASGGVGLFPTMAQFFPHSCDPNCVLVGTAPGRLAIRTVRSVSAGEPLTVSFVDLYHPREQRRRDLLINKRFWCECPRCSALLSNSVDRYMDGILCRRCRRGVMIFEETKEVADINALMKDVTILDNEIQGKCAECETCHTRIPVTELVAALKSAIEDFAAAMQLVRQRRLPEARQALEAYLLRYERGRVLHTYNSYLLNSLIPLMNACLALNDLHGAVTHNKTVLERMTTSGALPPFSPDIADFHVHLADLYLRLVRNRSGKQSRSGTILIERYRQWSRESFTRALVIYTVALGADHPKTQRVRQRRDAVASA